MPRVLEELFYGNIQPAERKYMQGSEFMKFARLKKINSEKLEELLNEQEKDIFEKYQDAYCDMNEISQYSYFTYGFKLGTLLMAETFFGLDDISEK